MSSLRQQPDRDPLLRAGFRLCSACSRAAFPVDAVWLDDRIILVTYAASCSHSRAITMVIDPGQQAALRIDPALYVGGRRCAAFNKRGGPCRAYAEPGSDFCCVHLTGASGRAA